MRASINEGAGGDGREHATSKTEGDDSDGLTDAPGLRRGSVSAAADAQSEVRGRRRRTVHTRRKRKGRGGAAASESQCAVISASSP